jgi:hypothetical protein
LADAGRDDHVDAVQGPDVAERHAHLLRQQHEGERQRSAEEPAQGYKRRLAATGPLARRARPAAREDETEGEARGSSHAVVWQLEVPRRVV